MQDSQAYLFSIKNLLILGVIVDEKQKGVGHKMAKDILKYLVEELENVVEWAETTEVY